MTTAGIGFDLAEIRIDRAGQRQPGADRVLEVEPSADAGIRRPGQRIPGRDRRGRHLRDDVRHQLEPLLAPRQRQAAELAERRDEAAGAPASSGQVEVSLMCAMLRTTAKPNVPADAGLKRSCENGILNSARQPSGDRPTATSHTASQPTSLLVSLNQ